MHYCTFVVTKNGTEYEAKDILKGYSYWDNHEFMDCTDQIREAWNDPDFFKEEFFDRYPDKKGRTPNRCFKDMYEFAEWWFGYTTRVGDSVGYMGNPNELYDWYEFGGRWDKILRSNRMKVSTYLKKHTDKIPYYLITPDGYEVEIGAEEIARVLQDYKDHYIMCYDLHN